MKRVACFFLALAVLPSRARVDILDTLILGDAASESSHHLAATRSESLTGALQQPARRLLPLDPPSWNGGKVAFTLKVDPARQNYVTVKLWGSDKGADAGRLLLFIDGLQVGYRHEGDYDVLNQCDDDPQYPKRFFYQTIPLPLMHTQGKSEVQLSIAALGRMWAYGANFSQKQKLLEVPSRPIYRVYAHTTPRFEPEAREVQGDPAPPPLRPDDTREGERLLAQMKETVVSRLNTLLSRETPTTQAKVLADQLPLLAEAYHTAWTPAYHNPRTIECILQLGDRYVQANTITEGTWIAAAPLGEALIQVWPELEPAMDATRRKAWASVLRASLDYLRTHRRAYTNQSMIVDRNLYVCNRALLLLDPQHALTEQAALRYLYEATGLAPWTGSDLPDGSSAKPYGSHYYQITKKGLSRELGYVGTYGETILKFTRDMAAITGDPRLRDQLVKIETTRTYFRYPSTDADGFHTMKLVSEIDNRTAHFPAPFSAYTIPDIREAWWLEVPAFTKDPLSVGAAQQMLEDHQYFPRLASRARDPDTLGMMRNIGEYAAVVALPKSSFRLPMTEGQPDFVFSDEEDAVVALKHGHQRLFINFYYRSEWGVNGVARVLDLTPTMLRNAIVKTNFEVTPSGHTWTRPDVIDMERTGGFPPPGEHLHQAWTGEPLPIAKRPDDAPSPRYGTWGPFVGKASFYSLRYGPYFFALNTSETESYPLPAPAGIPQALDLVTNKTVALSPAPTVSPLSTVVLYLPETR